MMSIGGEKSAHTHGQSPAGFAQGKRDSVRRNSLGRLAPLDEGQGMEYRY